MWVVTIQGEPPSEEIRIDGSVSEIRPLDGFVDTPNKLSSSQVGVVAWVALLTLVGVLPFFHRFMNYAAPQGRHERVRAGLRSPRTTRAVLHRQRSVAGADSFNTFEVKRQNPEVWLLRTVLE